MYLLAPTSADPEAQGKALGMQSSSLGTLPLPVHKAQNRREESEHWREMRCQPLAAWCFAVFSFLPRAPVSDFRTERIPGQLLQKERAQPSDENKQKCHKVALSKTHQLEKFHSELSCPKEGGWAEICRPACPISSALTGKSPGGQLPYSGVGFLKNWRLWPHCFLYVYKKKSSKVLGT